MKPTQNISGFPVAREESLDRHTISMDAVEYRTARSRQDYCGAFRILQRRYLEAGLSRKVEPEFRVLPYHLWDETQVFVAIHRREVIGSIGLIRDSENHGIPMQSTFPQKINELRDAGHSVGEVCSLTADSPQSLSNGDLFGKLTRMMMFQARFVGLDHIVAVVHPRHARFYQLAMGFEVIGETKAYGQVGGQPGTPILGSVNDRERYRPRWRPYYFDGNFSDEDLRPTAMSPSDKLYFRQFLQSTSESGQRRAA